MVEGKEDGYEEMKRMPAFRVYDLPENKAQDLIISAKRNSEGRVWKEIVRMMDICNSIEASKSVIERLDDIEMKLLKLEAVFDLIEVKQNKKKEVMVFGGEVGKDGK